MKLLLCLLILKVIYYFSHTHNLDCAITEDDSQNISIFEKCLPNQTNPDSTETFTEVTRFIMSENQNRTHIFSSNIPSGRCILAGMTCYEIGDIDIVRSFTEKTTPEKTCPFKKWLELLKPKTTESYVMCLLPSISSIPNLRTTKMEDYDFLVIHGCLPGQYLKFIVVARDGVSQPKINSFREEVRDTFELNGENLGNEHVKMVCVDTKAEVMKYHQNVLLFIMIVVFAVVVVISLIFCTNRNSAVNLYE